MTEEIQKLVVFQKKEIRRQLHNGEWWFVITDVVAVLTDSTDPARYVRDLRHRDEELAVLMAVDKGASQISTPLELPLETAGGKQKLPCWNTEGIFRLIQSIPSKKQSHSNDGSHAWVMNGYKRLRIRAGTKTHEGALQGEGLQ